MRLTFENGAPDCDFIQPANTDLVGVHPQSCEVGLLARNDTTDLFFLTKNISGVDRHRAQSLIDAAYRALGYRTNAPGVWVK